MTDSNPLLTAASRKTGNQPAVTWYGDNTERIELSFVTLANAVAKTAGFLVDELGLAPGEGLRLQLGNHWQVPVWIGACAATGLRVDLRPASTPAHDRSLPLVSFSIPDLVQTDSVLPVLVSANPFGLPGETPPNGIIDHAREVMSFPDSFFPDDDASRTFGLQDDSTLYNSQDIARMTSDLLQDCRIPRHGRVFTTCPPNRRPGWLTGWALPIYAGCQGVISSRDLDASSLDRLAAQEEIDVILTQEGGLGNQDPGVSVSTCEQTYSDTTG
jgi:uncharacterized protein (TIGR03089 family)